MQENQGRTRLLRVMPARCVTATPWGIEARSIEVEVDVRNGLPQTQIVGLPDAAVRESRERVRAAMPQGVAAPITVAITIAITFAVTVRIAITVAVTVRIAIPVAVGAGPILRVSGPKIAVIADPLPRAGEQKRGHRQYSGKRDN